MINSSLILYVESPGQLINAMEAIFYHKKDWTLIVRYNGRSVNDTQLEKVLGFYLNQNLHFFEQGEIVRIKSFGQFVWALSKSLLKYGTDNVFVGCHKSKYLALFRQLKLPMTLLDDGIASIVYAKNMVRLTSSKKNKRCDNDSTMPLFTCLPKCFTGDLNCTFHDFGLVRSLASSLPVSQLVYFFGAKYIEAGILSEQSYIELLRRVQSYFSGKKIVYLPHRGESRSRLDMYEEMGFEVYHPELPSELEFFHNGAIPAVVSGFFTAALFTTNVIFPDTEVISFQVPEDMVLNGSGNLDYIYEFFEGCSTLVDLEVNK